MTKSVQVGIAKMIDGRKVALVAVPPHGNIIPLIEKQPVKK